MASYQNRARAFGVPRVNTRLSQCELPFVMYKSASVDIFFFFGYFIFSSFFGSDEDIERMIRNGRKVKCLWVYAPESDQCSAMEAIMWELQRKVRQFHQSTETFWLHNGSIINRNLVKFSDWKPPMPLP